MTKLDPVLARVLARSFESLCAEMGSAMIRTAVSSVFVEARDFSCALLDDRAELVAAANYDPSHLSAMPLTAEYALMELGWEGLEDGDVLLVNDPYRGGGHLTDVCVIRPVFVDGELLALTMNRGHHIDIGGMAVSGFPGTARSIFQEGIRIPPVKWFEAGVERPQVMDMVLINVRFPREQLGDFRGQLASCIAAERRLLETVRRYGVETVRAAMAATKDHSEALMRAAIAKIPDGSYRYEDELDDDGLGRGPFRIAVEVGIDGDRATVDFSGTSAQADGPVNSSYGNTVGSVFNSFLHTLGAEIPFNHGCFRPLKHEIPRGSLLNPIAPAPVFGGVTETSIRVIDAVAGALGRAIPDQVAAGSYGTCINVAGGGWDAERKASFGFYLFQEGGWGATAWRDGWTSVPNPTSNFNTYPVEAIESELPLRCLEVALNEDSGGPGRQRGGLGTRRAYEVLADDLELSALAERFLIPPKGHEGGDAGGRSSLELQRAGDPDGSWRRFDSEFPVASPSKFASLPLRRGDRFLMATGGGGGFGDPRERDPERVVADVRAGLVSVEQAQRAYGVVVDPATGALDAHATAACRAAPAPATTPLELDLEPAGAPTGQDAEAVARIEALAARILPRRGDDPCRTSCAKRGEPTRCPYHHEFALSFWDAGSLAQWTGKHCPLATSPRAEARA